MGYKFTSPEGYHYRPGMIFLGVDEHGQDIGIETNRHLFTDGGSRGGKGAALLIPNAKRWTENLLCIDPKGEVAANAWQERLALGQQVAVLDPFDVATVPDALRATYNPLAEIKGDTVDGRDAIAAIGDGLIVSHDPKHMEWTGTGRTILSGVIALVVASAPPEQRNFAEVRRLLMQDKEIKDEAGNVIGGLYRLAQMMTAREDYGGMIRNAGSVIMTALEKGDGVPSQAFNMVKERTSWLDEDVIAESLSHSSFHLSDLKNGKLSVFVVLPPKALAHYGGFLRLFVKSALLAMEQSIKPKDGKDEKPIDRKCLFLLDEFYALGKLDEILTAAGLLPGYGVRLWPFVQNLGQLDLLYGEHGRNTILSTVDASIFFHLRDDAVAVSEKIGPLTPDDIGVTPPVMVAFNKYKDRNYLWDDERTAREKHNAAFANAQASYQHAMRMVGTPRIPPDMVREIVAARKVDEVARSMIVFAKGSDVLNLALYPHYATVKPRLQPSAYSPVKAKPEKNGIFDLGKRGMSWVFGAR